MFIRSRIVKGRDGKPYTYFSICQTRRENGKVKQVMLYNLGRHPTIGDAIEHEQRRLDFWRRHYSDDLVAILCARTQAKIDWLRDAQTNVVTNKSARRN